LGIVGVGLEAFLIGIVGGNQVALAMQSSAFSAPTFSPIRLDLGRLLGVAQGLRPVLLGSVGGRTVAVEDVVVRLESDGLGELFAEVNGQQDPRQIARGTWSASYIASPNFFAAIRSLPAFLRSSAEAMAGRCGIGSK
jgi:hypothetical protein